MQSLPLISVAVAGLLISNGACATENSPKDTPAAGTHPAGNLWRVNRQGRGWSEPLHLPATVNSDTSIWAPKPIDLGDAINGAGANDNNEPRLGPDRQTLYFSTDHATAIEFPRTQQQAQKDLERIQSWDNGSSNIWSVTLVPWLNAHPAK